MGLRRNWDLIISLKDYMNKSEWAAPKGYKINSEKEMAELVNDEKINSVIDSAQYIADDLFELNRPDLKKDEAARALFCDDIKEQGYLYGKWFHYPWNSSLVRFPEDEDYYNLRTFRNKKLITNDEQSLLRQKKIAAFGLSVGSNVIDSTMQSGIGNEYLLFDFDRLTPTNLNRIHAGMGQVGLLKTTVAGRKMAELDPYIEQQHFINGYDDNTDGILRIERPDIIIEEVDDLKVKARLRKIAGELKIPIVTAGDVADKVVLDIERHDLELVRPFNGKLSKKAVEDLIYGGGSKDREGDIIRLLGLANLSPRIIESAMVNGIELAGFPQLGTTASIGGAMASVAIRDILLGRKVESGSRTHDIRKSTGSGRPTNIIEDIDTMKRFIEYRRQK